MLAGTATALLLASCATASSSARTAQTPEEAGATTAAGMRAALLASASFPRSQRLAQTTSLTIRVRNVGSVTLPDVSVTICNVTCAYPAPPGEGTQAAPFSTDIATLPSLADPSRPVWILTRPPGPCGYGCAGGAQGGAATAYSNTWAFGPLAAGRTATFRWTLSAVRAGRHVVAWQIAPSLSGGALASGTLPVTIASGPPSYHVSPNGSVTEGR